MLVYWWVCLDETRPQSLRFQAMIDRSVKDEYLRQGRDPSRNGGMFDGGWGPTNC